MILVTISQINSTDTKTNNFIETYIKYLKKRKKIGRLRIFCSTSFKLGANRLTWDFFHIKMKTGGK